MAAGILSACGGPSSDDRRAAERIVAAYGRGIAEADGEAICATLTTRMVARYGGRKACPRATKRLSSDLHLTEAQTRVEEENGRLVGWVEASNGGAGGEVKLVKVEGTWRIDEDLSCMTPGCNQ